MSDSVTVGLIQFSLRPGMLRENLEATAKLLTSAASRGCELVILPEMWPVGYGNFDVFEKSEPVPGLYPDFMAENAKRLRSCIVAGVPERGAEREVFNAAVLVSDEGEIIARHRKLHLYTPLGEQKTWTAGERFTVAPDGEIEARAPRLSAGERAESFLLVKRLELRKRFEEARAKFSNFLRDRRPELYGSLANDLQQRRPYQLAKH